jgi:exopolysaccharide biosynthesis polyprenyl glycosylphosphotransferase
VDDSVALPLPAGAWVSPSPAPSRTRTRRSRRNPSTVAESTTLGSLTDLRAWIDARRAVAVPSIRVGTTPTRLPFALRAGDVLALTLTSLIMGQALLDGVLFSVVVLTGRAATNHYRQRIFLSMLDDVPSSFACALTAIAVLTVASESWEKLPVDNELLQRGAWFILIALTFEALIFALVRRERQREGAGRRTLVVGAGRVGETISEALLDHPALGLRPIGFLDSDVSETSQLSLPLLGTDVTKLAHTIAEYDIDTTILAFDGGGDAHIDTVIAVHQTGSNLFIVPSMFELHHGGRGVEHVRGVPLVRLRPDPTRRPAWWIKRAIDIGVGLIGLVVLAVPATVVAVLILLDSGGPVLFWQERVGMDGRTFRLCKFRSLRPRSENESQTTWTVAGDPRLGKVGRFLRRSSIDEMPQLWNIVRGQMSLVGPRPERPTFVKKFSQEHARYWARHRVPVGLTGFAQVNGLRGDTSIRERARYDNYYIANWSLWLDLKIVLLTAREVFGGRGR